MPLKTTIRAAAGTSPAGLRLQESVPSAIRSVTYWDEYAPWYQLWLDHTDYHQGIKGVLEGLVRPGWRVLDIGGGSGVLTLPMARAGAAVTVIEPSEVMRGYLRAAIDDQGRPGIAVIGKSWEELRPDEVRGFELAVACNSLHLTSVGEARALGKIIEARPARIFVASERDLPLVPGPDGARDYELAAGGSFDADNSFRYHSVEEALRHLDLKDRHGQDHPPREEFVRSLVYRDGHFVRERRTTVRWSLLLRAGR